MCSFAILRTFVLFLLALISIAGAADVPRPQIQLLPSAEGKAAIFIVVNLGEAELAALKKLAQNDAAWRETFFVRVAGNEAKEPNDVPAMLGSYAVQDGRLLFTPRFPLLAGLKYSAVLDLARLPGAKDKSKLLEEFALPAVEKPAAAKVVAVYPSGDRLPENQLKFYVQFSAPMSRGEAYAHVQLLDEKGKPVLFPFLRIDEELWNRAGDRLTLLCEPGRVKRGLKPREEEGPILEEGKRYTLVVDRRWPDATGQPLSETFRKSFEALAPVDGAIDVKQWKLTAPRAGASQPLVVKFQRPLDHACLQRMLTVEGPDGKPMDGRVTIADQESRWEFTPASPWVKGKHHLVADTVLEDLAGNSIGRAFEVDEFRPITTTTPMETVKIPFVVQ